MSLPQTYKAIIGNEKGEISIKEFPLPKPSNNQVLVKVEFAPINPTDFNKLNGVYGKPDNYDTTLHGSEGSGVVVAVGENLKSPFKVGDRVHILEGSWGQYVLAESEQVSHILQDDLSFEHAASHWINPATVYVMGMLADEGKHKAAIHNAGSSALGRMLIRYFKQKGIKLINIVRREEYVKELLEKEGADYVLNSQDPDFEAKLKELAEKEHATLAFDAIGGDFTNKILKSQPLRSECMVYGQLSGIEIKKIDTMELVSGRKRVSGLYIFGVIEDLLNEQGWAQFEKFREEVHSLVPTTLSSHVQKVFKLEDIHEAVADYKENSSKGKILLKLN